jgi:hypothetical protein
MLPLWESILEKLYKVSLLNFGKVISNMPLKKELDK